MTETNSSQATWEEKEASQKAELKVNPIYKQLVYISTPDHPCEPTPITFELKENSVPFVVDRPTGFKNPKFIWVPDDGSKAHWIEADTDKQGERLASVEQAVNTLGTAAKQLQEVQQASAVQSGVLQKQLAAGQQAMMATQKTTLQMATLLQQVAAKVGVTPVADSKSTDDKTEDKN